MKSSPVARVNDLLARIEELLPGAFARLGRLVAPAGAEEPSSPYLPERREWLRPHFDGGLERG